MVKTNLLSLLVVTLLLSVTGLKSLENTETNHQDFAILKNYQELIATTDGDVDAQNITDRKSKKEGKFCSLCVAKAATVGCLNAKGNILFNTAVINTLNAQGALYARYC